MNLFLIYFKLMTLYLQVTIMRLAVRSAHSRFVESQANKLPPESIILFLYVHMRNNYFPNRAIDDVIYIGFDCVDDYVMTISCVF